LFDLIKGMHTSRSLILTAVAALVVGLAGCGKSTPEPTAATPAAKAADAFPGMEADLQRTLKEQSNFYHFKTPADLANDTKGLTWEDASELPEFADLNAKKGGTITLWVPDFPGTLRTIGQNATGSIRPFLLDYVAPSFLLAYPNSPGKDFPELALSWAVDRATKTVYFKLDPDAVWSDGVPLTTDDVVFSWYFYRSPALNEPWYNDFYTKTYSGLTVYDAHTFSVTLSELKPDIADRAGSIIPYPKHFFKDFGPGWEKTYDWRVCPTLGAYTIHDEDIKRTSSITLSHVPNWWAANRRFQRGRFNPDKIRLSVVRDPDKAFEAFVHGDLDIFILSTQQWFDKLPETAPSVVSGFTVKTTFYNQIPRPDIGLWINQSMPGLDNLDVRLGIQYASNFKLVCQQYFRGQAEVQKTASDGYGFDPNPAVRPRLFDPDKARSYFAKAGYIQQGPDGVLVNAEGKRLSFTITTTYKKYEDVLVILKQEALKAGLEFNIEVLDETTGWQKVQEKKHEITLAGFSRGPEMYPRYWECFSGDNAYDVPYLPDGSPNPARKVKKNTNNFNIIADFKLDQLIKAYDKADNMDEVKDLAAKMEQILYDNAAWVNGWEKPYYQVGYRPWIKWPKDFDAMQSLDFQNFWLMWIDPDSQKDALAAKAEGRNLTPQVLTYDKFKD
jgi:microcin C transport system substrate-binding protein